MTDFVRIPLSPPIAIVVRWRYGKDEYCGRFQISPRTNCADPVGPVMYATGDGDTAAGGAWLLCGGSLVCHHVIGPHPVYGTPLECKVFSPIVSWERAE